MSFSTFPPAAGRRLAPAVYGLLATAALATGCSGGTSHPKAAAAGSPPASPAATSTAAGSPAASSTPATTSSAPTATTPATPTSSASNPAASPTSRSAGRAGGTVRNLVVSDAVRAGLVRAAAVKNSLPAAAYTGLAPGRTYYAYDAATGTYWAGGALLPSAGSEAAQVSVQDEGAYYVFRRAAGGAWTALPVGGAPGDPCVARVPDGVLAAWHWPTGSCRPAV